MFINYDITFCDNEQCPKKDMCYRNIAYREYQKLVKQGKTDHRYVAVTRGKADGRYVIGYNGECMLFPSKEQCDWSKFVAPKPDLPEGTWVMCSDDDDELISDATYWVMREYYNRGTTSCRYSNAFSTWKYIIPFDKFDPNNIEECIKKYNYSTKEV